jgi:pyridoxine 5-phosphate synthase
MARLGINIENITLIRLREKNSEPDPVQAVAFVELAGADGIVCPIRPEFQLITERDVRLLKEVVKTHLNLKITPIKNLLTLALSTVPDMITLVPGKKPGSTQGGGLDVLGRMEELTRIVHDIRGRDIVVSLLIEPIIQQVKAAAKVGADYVEFHLGRYSLIEGLNERMDMLENVNSVSLAASKIGLGVAAGHGLNYSNITEITSLEKIEEVNIGQAVIARALWVGMEQAVRDMVALVQ